MREEEEEEEEEEKEEEEERTMLLRESMHICPVLYEIGAQMNACVWIPLSECVRMCVGPLLATMATTTDYHDYHAAAPVRPINRKNNARYPRYPLRTTAHPGLRTARTCAWRWPGRGRGRDSSRS